MYNWHFVTPKVIFGRLTFLSKWRKLSLLQMIDGFLLTDSIMLYWGAKGKANVFVK